VQAYEPLMMICKQSVIWQNTFDLDNFWLVILILTVLTHFLICSVFVWSTPWMFGWFLAVFGSKKSKKSPISTSEQPSIFRFLMVRVFHKNSFHNWNVFLPKDGPGQNLQSPAGMGVLHELYTPKLGQFIVPRTIKAPICVFEDLW